jgi:hypothetical protein
MKLQKVDGLNLYVVDLKTMPQLPITGSGPEKIYAEILTTAIRRGLVKVPGKYGIHIEKRLFRPLIWNIYKITD